MELTRRVALRPFQLPKISWTWIPLALLVGLLILILAYPLGMLFVKSFVISRPGQPTVWAVNGWVEAFTDVNLAIAIGNTFYLAFVRVIITSVLAIFFAWVVTRTDTPLKGFIEVALWLGFFLPLLPMTMGWILLLDPYYGIINKFLMKVFALSRPPFDIYSYWGIIWCHLAFSTSVRFLLMTPAFTAMDAALEDAARTSGSSNMGVLVRITVPILAPAILASTALGFIRSLESLEIEMVLGIPAGIYVVPTKIWDYLHWEPPLYDRQRPQLYGPDLSTGPLALGDVRVQSALYSRDDCFALGDPHDGHVHGIFRQFRHREGLDGTSLDRGLCRSGVSALFEKHIDAGTCSRNWRDISLCSHQLCNRAHAASRPRAHRHSLVVTMGFARGLNQPGASMGGVGLG